MIIALLWSLTFSKATREQAGKKEVQNEKHMHVRAHEEG